MVQSLDRCRSCGLPSTLAENMDWPSNGTVILRRFKAIRLAMFDAVTMDRLYDGLTAEEGPEAFYRMEKGATRFMTGRFLSGLKGRVSRYGVVKKKLLEVMEDLSVLLGMGRIEVERFTPAQGGSLLLREPFNLHLVTASIAGALEEIDRCPYRPDHTSLKKNAFRLLLEVATKDDYDTDSFKGLPLISLAIGNGGKLDRCDNCGLPAALRGFRWNEIYGMVETGTGNRRFAFLPLYTLAIMGEMAVGKKGHGTRGLIEEVAYTSTLERLEGGENDAFDGEGKPVIQRDGVPVEEAWDGLQVKGWGIAAGFQADGDGWRVTIINPVEVNLLAGWLRALYTFAMGKKPRLSVTEEASRAQYVLE